MPLEKLSRTRQIILVAAFLAGLVGGQVSGARAEGSSPTVSPAGHPVGSPAEHLTGAARSAAQVADDPAGGFPEMSLEDCVLIDSGPCVAAALGRGDAPDTPDAEGLTPLFVAVGADSLAATRALMAANADPDRETPRGTASEYALAAGSPEMVRTLLGGDRDKADRLLLRAVRDGDVGLVRIAESLGADPSAGDPSGATALAIAVAAHNLEIVRMLLAMGASTLAPRGSQAEPVAIAILAEDGDALDLLLESGADPDRPVAGLLPLELASMRGSLDLVERLLAAGAEPKRAGAAGSRPGEFAAAIGQIAIAERLRGADLIGMIRSGQPRAAVAAAITSGADVNARDPSGMPAVVVAAAMGRSDVLYQLARDGADLLATTPDGVNVLAAALSVEDEDKRLAVAQVVLHAAQVLHIASDMLRARDTNGRSPAVLLAARIVRRIPFDRQIYEERFADFLDDEVMRAVANEADTDGVSPYVAAVLADSYQMTRYFARTLGLPPPVTEGVSLQDLARARGAWAALAGLPDDRVLPEGLAYGASEGEYTKAKRDLQASLKAWGYYAGTVDGAFGAGSRAALTKLLEERQKEVAAVIKAVSDSDIELNEEDAAKADVGNITYYASWAASDQCDWIMIRWKGGDDTLTDLFGCQREVDDITYLQGNTTAIVSYEDGTVQVQRIGRDGWNTMKILQ